MPYSQRGVEDKVILLVDDNPDDVDLTLRALRNNNVVNEVVVARDGSEALDLLLGESRIKPTLVLLDLKLPKVEGLEVLRRLRADERTKLLPVVILTSSKEEKDLVEGYGLGANSYVRKPVKFERFISAVQHLRVYWLLWNEPPPVR
jgi:two-component system response regulator